MIDDPDRDRPGVNDLVTPFIFVPHGARDPVEWKRAHPGWVSFPATFVPHTPPTPKWTVINGKRWPLSRKGQPWPSNRFGRPICPLNEFPSGVPAPGTQPEHMQHIENACRRVLEPGGIDVAWFLAQGARARAEREAKRAAEPSGPPPASTLDGFEPAREYLASMRRVDAHMREFADAARQRSAARLTALETASPQGASAVPVTTDSITDSSPAALEAMAVPGEGEQRNDAAASAVGTGPVLSDSDGPMTHLPDGTPLVPVADRRLYYGPDSVFLPYTPSNQAFIRDTGKAIGFLRDALGNTLGGAGAGVVRNETVKQPKEQPEEIASQPQ